MTLAAMSLGYGVVQLDVTIVNTALYPSKEARDAALKTGMTEGVAQSFDRLEKYLMSLAG